MAFPYPPGLVCAGRGVLPAADGQACSGGFVRVCVCGCVRSLDHRRGRLLCLLRPSASALVCRGFITGAGGLYVRLQLYVHYVAPYRARGGCRAFVFLFGASMAQGAV